MKVVILKLRCGDLVIGRLLSEDEEKLVLEKVCLLENNRMYPWLFATQDPLQRVVLQRYDLLLPPLVPKPEVENQYLKYTSEVAIPTGSTPPPPPPGYGGGVPPTRGGGVPPTRGGLM